VTPHTTARLRRGRSRKHGSGRSPLPAPQNITRCPSGGRLSELTRCIEVRSGSVPDQFWDFTGRPYVPRPDRPQINDPWIETEKPIGKGDTGSRARGILGTPRPAIPECDTCVGGVSTDMSRRSGGGKARPGDPHRPNGLAARPHRTADGGVRRARTPPRRRSRPAKAWPAWTSTTSAAGLPGTAGSPLRVHHTGRGCGAGRTPPDARVRPEGRLSPSHSGGCQREVFCRRAAAVIVPYSCIRILFVRGRVQLSGRRAAPLPGMSVGCA
jgi:hypothetical protein